MSYAVFDLADYAAFGNDFGGAVVIGSGPLAGTAIAIRDKGTGPAAKAELTYRAFTADQQGAEILLPLFYNNFNKFNSGINVVNRGAAATDVTVEYTGSMLLAHGLPHPRHCNPDKCTPSINRLVCQAASSVRPSFLLPLLTLLWLFPRLVLMATATMLRLLTKALFPPLAALALPCRLFTTAQAGKLVSTS